MNYHDINPAMKIIILGAGCLNRLPKQKLQVLTSCKTEGSSAYLAESFISLSIPPFPTIALLFVSLPAN